MRLSAALLAASVVAMSGTPIPLLAVDRQWVEQPIRSILLAGRDIK
jgi:hypothetical protein